jgi:hypothetical protein
LPVLPKNILFPFTFWIRYQISSHCLCIVHACAMLNNSMCSRNTDAPSITGHRMFSKSHMKTWKFWKQKYYPNSSIQGESERIGRRGLARDIGYGTPTNRHVWYTTGKIQLFSIFCDSFVIISKTVTEK